MDRSPRALASLLVALIGCAGTGNAVDAGVDAGGGPDVGPDTAAPRDAGEPPLAQVNARFEYAPPQIVDGGVEPDAGPAIPASDEEVLLLVIFDKSGSMGDYWDGGTRWTAASTALLNAIWPHRERVTVGALLFPQRHLCEVPDMGDESQIPWMPAPRFIDEWIDGATVNGPSGSTPMGAAFAAADDAITRAAEEGLLDRRLEVLLLTDGAPNCDTVLEELEAYAGAWLEEGIRTNVMGLPGSMEAVEVLDAIAAAGGTEAHQPVGDPGELEESIGALL